MGNGEAAPPVKSDKASSPVKEQPAVHPYPDWATHVQAYYGPGVAMPPPYMAAVASGHAPPYIWGPQPFVPPYGTPFSAIYTHGVYAHPSVALGSHSQGQGIVPTPTTNEAVVMATPLSIEPPAKSPGSKGRGLLKKLKGLDGLPVSNSDSKSRSGESCADGSSDGSDGNNESGDNNIQRRGSSEDCPTSGKDEKAVRPGDVNHGGETNQSFNVASSSRAPGIESTKVPANGEVKAVTTLVPLANGVPIELWRQDERTLKRERRKQSNRESARRSRLRKQAETEELAIKVENLGAENMTLRTEIIQLKESSEKLRLENAALMETLKNAQLIPAEEASAEKANYEDLPTVSTENFLSRLNNTNPFSSSDKHEGDSPGNSSGKLHQLLGLSPRTDAVAAS